MAANRLAAFRGRKDELFRDPDHSPLVDAERAAFPGLEYFEENEALALALPLDTTGDGIGDRVTVDLSDGKQREYIRIGRVSFEVDGAPVTFAIYQDVDRRHYFLPFIDGTTGTETYENGRFLEPHPRPDERFNVDFNYAYNPYCAYSGGWSCPYPPAENHTTVAIRAGERGRVHGTGAH